MPLLAHHDHVATCFYRGSDDVIDEARRQARVPVADLLFLAVIDASTMAGRDPLAPSAVDEAARLVAFLAGQVGVATEVEVRLVADLGKGAREALDPHPEATCLAVDVGPLEAEDYEHRVRRREDHHSPASARIAVA